MRTTYKQRWLALGAATVLAAGIGLSTSAFADPASGDGGGEKGPNGTPTAAEVHDWGEPVPEGSDEFNYGSEEEPAVPDESKWNLAGGGVDQCGPGHDGNGQRCDKNSRVYGNVLRQTGDANGDTGWLGSKFGQQYGKWEARVRSEATGEDSERAYHPLLILWPDSDQWPQDGEYDYLENMSPGEECAGAFIHYPHQPGDVQQEHAEKCGVDLTKWHNVAVEWTSEYVKGFIDGEEWFSFSGGENDIRDCIQCAPSMHQTIQLDNFHGDNMQTANYEVDWIHAYTP